MHPARLSFLATRHAQKRGVVAREERANGTRLTLECGHEAIIAPHFDARQTEHCNCSKCGETYVLMAPQYAREFEKGGNP